MGAFFSVSVTFLDPVASFHGRGDGGIPEWPPSPLRLFQAIVAAAASRWHDGEFMRASKAALEWFERQARDAPPLIIAPVHHVGLPLRTAVPNNDLDLVAAAWAKRQEPKKKPSELKTLKTIRPTRMRVKTEESAIVHYLFPLGESVRAFEQHHDTLQAALRRVSHLGWGIDMVAASGSLISAEEAVNLAGERWQAVEDSSASGYRVPIPGTLDELVNKHHAFLTRLGPDGFKPVPPLSLYGIVRYRRGTDEPRRGYIAFKLLHPTEDRFAWFAATRANRVAAMMRHATASAATHEPQDWVDSYVHGHRGADDDVRGRFSYLPLPTIEHRGEAALVLGGIRRAILAEFVESSDSYRTWAQQHLPGHFLTDEESGDRKAMLAPLNDSDWVLKQYTQPSHTWATVTPVVLPGSDDGKFSKTEKLFLKALRHAGYAPESLADLDFRNVSFWPGGDLALRFYRPEYLRRGHWSVYHVRLRWHQPIRGPLALGAGRHCGLGIFAGMNE